LAARTKEELLERLGLNGVLNLADYFGKLKRRRAMQEPCSGTESGFSVHGSVFVLRNLDEQQRATVGAGTDWTGIPLPVGEKNMFLEVDCRTVSDCSKQNPFTMRSAMEAELTALSSKFPHLRLAYRITDNCSDYHSTQAAIAHNEARCGNIRVAEVHYHETGEGKNEVDSYCARSKAKIQRWLNAGNDCEIPEQLQKALEAYAADGEWTMTIEADFAREERDNKAPPIPGISSYSCEVHHESGGITFYEAGRYGDGVEVPATQLSAHDQHKLGAAGTGVGVVASDVAGGAKVRQSKSMQRAGREEGIEQTKALAASGGAGKAAKAAFAAAAAPPPGRVCKRCRTAFLSDNGLLQHKCAAARARRSTIADRVLQSCRASAAAEEAAARKLRSVTATYTSPESSGGWDAVLGMTVGETGRVEGTVNGGATDKMMTVEAGWRVLTIGGTEVTGAGDCETAVDAQPRGKKFDVVFERTLPPVPQRGWARKAFAQKARTAVTDECRAFLDEQFAAAAEHGLKARAAAVHKAMNSGALDAQHCVGVSVRYIEALFSRKSRAAKDAALRAIIKGEDEDDETGEEGEEDEDEDKDEDTGPEDKEVDDDGWGTGGDGDEEDGE
jgi:hypothetical protein